MITDALQAPNPMHAIADSRNEIELTLMDVRRAARARRIALNATAVTIATGIVATGNLGGYEDVKWIFDGIGLAVGLGTTPLVEHLLGKKRNEFSYLIRSYDVQGFKKPDAIPSTETWFPAAPI